MAEPFFIVCEMRGGWDRVPSPVHLEGVNILFDREQALKWIGEQKPKERTRYTILEVHAVSGSGRG